MNFLDYEPRANQVDQLWTTQLLVPLANSTTLKFDVAYQEYVPVGQLHDTLKVLVSTDCGATTTELYKKYGSDLSTTGKSGPGFIPQNRGEWRRDSVDLSSFAGQDVIIIFEAINRNGNDLFLDNISIYEGASDPMDLSEENYRRYSLYPVPTVNVININDSKPGVHLNYSVTDLSGKMIFQGTFKPGEERSLSVGKLKSGTYLLRISFSGGTELHRFVKN